MSIDPDGRPSFDSLVAGTKDDAGAPVTFSVDGTTATTDSKVTWKPGQVESVHLIVKSGKTLRTSDDSEGSPDGKKKSNDSLELQVA